MKPHAISDASWRSILDAKDFRAAEAQCAAEKSERTIDGRPIAHVLVENGFVEAARVLVRKGQNLDAPAQDGRTLLDVAAATGNPHALAFAIGATSTPFRTFGQAGSHEEAFCKKAGWSASGAQVPISEGMKQRAITAIKEGRDALLDSILGSHGHEIFKRSFPLDRSLAHVAAINGRGASTVDVLAAHNMPFDTKDALKFTPKELAEFMGNHEFIAAVELAEERKTSFRI